jgi:hypothetical protein
MHGRVCLVLGIVVVATELLTSRLVFSPAIMVIPRIWSKVTPRPPHRIILTNPQAGFTFYIALAFLWTFLAAFIVVVYPVVSTPFLFTPFITPPASSSLRF